MGTTTPHILCDTLYHASHPNASDFLALGYCLGQHWDKVPVRLADYESSFDYAKIVEKLIESNRPEVWDRVTDWRLVPSHYLNTYAALSHNHYVLASLVKNGLGPSTPEGLLEVEILLGNELELARLSLLMDKSDTNYYSLSSVVHLSWTKKKVLPWREEE